MHSSPTRVCQASNVFNRRLGLNEITSGIGITRHLYWVRCAMYVLDAGDPFIS